jgi:alkylation response protein AidB-like acyl-CoA dehydrogenase
MVIDSAQESRAVAEAARETKWKEAAFLRDLFLGRLRFDLICPFPEEPPERPEFRRFYDRVKAFLVERVDPAAIDEGGAYPRDVIEGLAQLGAFGMKIPSEYGGLGFSQRLPNLRAALERGDGQCDAVVDGGGVIRLCARFSEREQRVLLCRAACWRISAAAGTR